MFMGYYYSMENPNLPGIMNTLLGLPLENGQVKSFSGEVNQVENIMIINPRQLWFFLENIECEWTVVQVEVVGL